MSKMCTETVSSHLVPSAPKSWRPSTCWHPEYVSEPDPGPPDVPAPDRWTGPGPGHGSGTVHGPSPGYPLGLGLLWT